MPIQYDIKKRLYKELTKEKDFIAFLKNTNMTKSFIKPHLRQNKDYSNDFSSIKKPKKWGNSYIDPYSSEGTYNARIRAAGIETVAPNSWHFGKDGHSFWNRFMLQYINTHNKV
jgi:hypothetical protein